MHFLNASGLESVEWRMLDGNLDFFIHFKTCNGWVPGLGAQHSVSDESREDALKFQ
jgi:hypothetical protein